METPIIRKIRVVSAFSMSLCSLDGYEQRLGQTLHCSRNTHKRWRDESTTLIQKCFLILKKRKKAWAEGYNTMAFRWRALPHILRDGNADDRQRSRFFKLDLYRPSYETWYFKVTTKPFFRILFHCQYELLHLSVLYPELFPLRLFSRQDPLDSTALRHQAQTHFFVWTMRVQNKIGRFNFWQPRDQESPEYQLLHETPKAMAQWAL